MNHLSDPRNTRSGVREAKAIDASRGIAESAWPWIAGFFGVLTALLYRETLRALQVARSLNW